MRPQLLLLLVAAATAAAWSCHRPQPKPQPTGRLESLKRTHDTLHARLEQLVALDPLATRVFADPGQVAIAVRTQFIKDLVTEGARQYLKHVAILLDGVQAGADGEVHAGKLLGHAKVGNWRADVTIEHLTGWVETETPVLRIPRNNVLEVEVPVQIREVPGKVGIRFAWDSASVVNAVCKDFDLSRDLDGRVLAQRHIVTASVRISAGKNSLIASPDALESGLLLRLDLTPDSWATVETALRSQDTLGRCGLFLKPEKVLDHLHELAAKGINIHLPASLLRPVELPTRFEQTVSTGTHEVKLSLATGAFQMTPELLFTSSTIGIDRGPNAVASPATGGP
jgi:hypothetical protein